MTQNAAVRPPGREHIPNYPPGFIALRILQFVFSVVLLGLVGYSVSMLPFVSSIIMMYTTLITFIVTLWQIIAHFWAPQAYNYWAVLAFDIKLVIFWLISFAFVAATAAVYWAAGSYSYSYSYYYYSDNVFGGIIAATAGLGALEFLFFKISLIIHSIMVCRHRRAGLHNKPTPVSGVQAVPVPVQVAPGGFQPQQQAYGMQPIYNQAPPPGFQQQQHQQPIPEKQQIPPVVTPSPPPNQPQMFHQPQPIAPVQQFPQGQFQQPPQGYAEMYSPHHHQQPPPFPNQAPPQ